MKINKREQKRIILGGKGERINVSTGIDAIRASEKIKILDRNYNEDLALQILEPK